MWSLGMMGQGEWLRKQPVLESSQRDQVWLRRGEGERGTMT